MPGETLDDGLGAAKRFAQRGLPTSFTYLGENVATEAEADAVTRHYLLVLERVADAQLDTEISVKLTHLGFDVGQEVAQSNLLRLVQSSEELGNWTWIDMESHEYVDGTLAAYRRALETFTHVGLCLQAYLHRTEQDITDLLPHGPSIRLVKGAYREPADVAMTKKVDIDSSFLRLSKRLVEERTGGRAHRVAIATHDIGLIEQLEAFARGRGMPKDAFEIQMLYGIRQVEQFRFAEAGRPARSLIAYGPAWYPWYMRRLAEKPSNVWFVLRNLFARHPLTEESRA
jgi:proline dehydrogenase